MLVGLGMRLACSKFSSAHQRLVFDLTRRGLLIFSTLLGDGGALVTTLAVTGGAVVAAAVCFGMGRPVLQSVFSTTSW